MAEPLTLDEVIAGAERATARVRRWPEWMLQLSPDTRAVLEERRKMPFDDDVSFYAKRAYRDGESCGYRAGYAQAMCDVLPLLDAIPVLRTGVAAMMALAAFLRPTGGA